MTKKVFNPKNYKADLPLRRREDNQKTHKLNQDGHAPKFSQKLIKAPRSRGVEGRGGKESSSIITI